jgi:hypothetical protein
MRTLQTLEGLHGDLGAGEFGVTTDFSAAGFQQLLETVAKYVPGLPESGQSLIQRLVGGKADVSSSSWQSQIKSRQIHDRMGVALLPQYQAAVRPLLIALAAEVARLVPKNPGVGFYELAASAAASMISQLVTKTGPVANILGIGGKDIDRNVPVRTARAARQADNIARATTELFRRAKLALDRSTRMAPGTGKPVIGAPADGNLPEGAALVPELYVAETITGEAWQPVPLPVLPGSPVGPGAASGGGGGLLAFVLAGAAAALFLAGDGEFDTDAYDVVEDDLLKQADLNDLEGLGYFDDDYWVSRYIAGKRTNPRDRTKIVRLHRQIRDRNRRRQGPGVAVALTSPTAFMPFASLMTPVKFTNQIMRVPENIPIDYFGKPTYVTPSTAKPWHDPARPWLRGVEGLGLTPTQRAQLYAMRMQKKADRIAMRSAQRAANYYARRPFTPFMSGKVNAQAKQLRAAKQQLRTQQRQVKQAATAQKRTAKKTAQQDKKSAQQAQRVQLQTLQTARRQDRQAARVLQQTARQATQTTRQADRVKLAADRRAALQQRQQAQQTSRRAVQESRRIEQERRRKEAEALRAAKSKPKTRTLSPPASRARI